MAPESDFSLSGKASRRCRWQMKPGRNFRITARRTKSFPRSPMKNTRSIGRVFFICDFGRRGHSQYGYTRSICSVQGFASQPKPSRYIG